MKNLVLPRFFKIKDPEKSNSSDTELSDIKFAVTEYVPTDDDSVFIIKLGCNRELYDRLAPAEVEDDGYAIPIKAMHLWIECEMAKILAACNDATVIITDAKMYRASRPGMSATLDLTVKFLDAAITFDGDYFKTYGINNKLMPQNANDKNSKFSWNEVKPCSFVNDGFNDCASLEKRNIYDYATLDFALNNSDFHRLKALYLLKINNTNIMSISDEDLNAMANPTGLNFNTAGMRTSLITDILNRFITFSTMSSPCVGSMSVQRKVHVITPTVIAADRNTTYVCRYAKPNLLLEGHLLNPVFELNFDNEAGTYRANMLISNRYEQSTMYAAAGLVNEYWSQLKNLENLMPDEIDESISAEIGMKGVSIILSGERFKKANMATTSFVKAFMPGDKDCPDWDGVGGYMPHIVKDAVYALLNRQFLSDVINMYIQYQTDVGCVFPIVPLDALNTNVKYKDENIPQLFASRETSVNNIKIDFDPHNTGCVHVQKKGMTIINPEFKKTMGTLIRSIPCVLSRGVIQIYQNGSFMICDTKTVSMADDTDGVITLDSVLAEYMMTAACVEMDASRPLYDNAMIKTRRMNACIRPDTLCGLVPRPTGPLRFIVVGGYNAPQN